MMSDVLVGKRKIYVEGRKEGKKERVFINLQSMSLFSINKKVFNKYNNSLMLYKYLEMLK